MAGGTGMQKGTSVTNLHLYLLAITTLSAIAPIGCGSGDRHITPPNSCAILLGPNSPSGSIGSVVDPLIVDEMKAQALVGVAVAIAKNGSVLYAQGYGYADLQTCEPVQPAAEFQIGSVTK